MRFIVVTDSAGIADRERDLITAFLEGKGWAVWHWFKDLWLVDEAPEGTKFSPLRDEIQALFEQPKNIMIMTTEGLRGHAGTVPTKGIQWINDHWKRQPSS